MLGKIPTLSSSFVILLTRCVQFWKCHRAHCRRSCFEKRRAPHRSIVPSRINIIQLASCFWNVSRNYWYSS